MHFGTVALYVTIVTGSVTICLIAILLLQMENFEFKSTMFCCFYLLFVSFTDVYKILKGGLPQNVTCFVFQVILLCLVIIDVM